MTRIRSTMVLRLGWCLLIGVIVGALTSWWGTVGLFGGFRGGANDVLFPRGDLGDHVAIVAIDRGTLETVGESWPWPRDQLAALVMAVEAAGPSLIVVDLLLADARDGDDDLRAAVGASGTVVLLGSPLELIDDGPGRPLRAATFLAPGMGLAESAVQVAASTSVPDPRDGVVRQQPLIVHTPDGAFVPSPALAALQHTAGPGDPPVLRQPAGIQVGRTLIPTDDRYRLTINWPADLADAERPASAVLDGTVGAPQLADRVVFIGVTDPTLADRSVSPVSDAAGTPGVHQHVAAYDTMVAGRFLRPATIGESALWVGFLALAISASILLLPLLAAIPASLTLVGSAVAGVLLRADQGVVVDVLDPLLGAVVAIPAGIGVREILERRRGRRLTRLFAEYVPAPVATVLAERGLAGDAVAGQRVEVSVLFCDLRDFTPLAGGASARTVQQVLTEFYGYVSSIVLDLDGTIVQYVGDEVFAVFGAPLPMAQHADRAVAAACALQAHRDHLDARVAPLVGEVGFGNGVHSGEVVAALAGNRFHRQYALIGDPVNVGSRLCGQAATGEVVVSDATVERLEHDPGGLLIDLDLKGIDREVFARRLLPARCGTSERVRCTHASVHQD